MYIQLNYYSRQPTGNFLAALPDFFSLSPSVRVPVTTENAESLGFVDFEKYVDHQITGHILATVQAARFDSLANCAAYAVLPSSPFREKAMSLIAWADAVWQHVVEAEAQLLAGERELVSIDEFIKELPAYEQ